MKAAAGLLCGLATLREFKQIIRLPLLTDECTGTHTNTTFSWHADCVYLSPEHWVIKHGRFQRLGQTCSHVCPTTIDAGRGEDAGPRAPSAGEPGELWPLDWRVTACVYLLRGWLYLMWQSGWSIKADSRSQRYKYWDGQVPRERFKMLECTNQFVVKRAYCSEMCPPSCLCVAASLNRSGPSEKPQCIIFRLFSGRSTLYGLGPLS